MPGEVRAQLVLDPNVAANLSKARILARQIQNEFNRAFASNAGNGGRIDKEIAAVQRLNREVVQTSRNLREASGQAAAASRREAQQLAAAQRTINTELRRQVQLQRQITQQQGRSDRARIITQEARALTQLIQAEQRRAQGQLRAARTTEERVRASLNLERINIRLAQSGIRLQRAIDSQIRSERRLITTQDRLAQSQLRVASANNTLVRGGDQAATAALNLDRAQEEAADSAQKLDRAIQQEANSLRLSGQRISALNGDLRRSRDAKRALTQETTSSTRRFGAFSTVLGTVKTALATLGIISVTQELVQLAIEVQRTGIEFESTFTNVIKTVDGVTDSVGELTSLGVRLRGELLQIGRDVPVSFQEINQIAALGGQLGVDPALIPEFTDIIARLDVAVESLDAEQIAVEFAQIANILNLSQDELEQFSSAIVDLGNNTATTEDRILNFTRRIAGAGDLAGLSASEIAGIGAAFASAGVEAEAGGTAVQRALLEMTTAVAEGGGQLEGFASVVGLTGEQFREQFRAGGGADLFIAFIEGLASQGEDAIVTLDSLGLANQRSIRALLAVANAGGLLRETVERSNFAFEENIALLEESELRFGTAESAIQLLRNAWDQLKVAFADTETIKAGATAVTDAINGITDTLLRAQQVTQIQEFVEGLGPQFVQGVTLPDLDEVRDGQRPGQGRIDDIRRTFDPAVEFANILEQAVFFQDQLGQEIEDLNRVSERTRIAMFLIEEGVLDATASVEDFRNEINQIETSFGTLDALQIFDRLQASGSIDLTTEQLRELARQIAEGEIALDSLTQGVRDIVEGRIEALPQGPGGLLSQEGVAEATFGVQNLNDELLIEQGILRDLAPAVEDFGDSQDEAAESAQRLTERTEAVTGAIASYATEIVSSGDGTNQWVTELIQAAVEAGATSDQLLELIGTTGALTDEQLQGAESAGLFALKQVEVFQAVQDGELSYAAAANVLAQYRRQLGLAAVDASAFAAAQREAFAGGFLSALQRSGGGSGGASGAEEEDPFAEFTDDFLSNIRKIREDGLDEFRQELVDSDDGVGQLANSLLDLSQSSGATISQLQELAIALGAATPEEAAAAFQQIVSQRALDTLAQGFVDGRVTAEQAAAAVQLMNQQLAEGQDIDLSSLGINLDALAASADVATASVSGGAGATEDWRDEIIKTLDPSLTLASTYLEVARATGIYEESAIRAALVSGAMTQAVDGLSQSANDVDFEQAISQLEEYERLLGTVSTTDELALILDLQTELGRTPEDIVNAFEVAFSRGISVPITLIAQEAGQQALEDNREAIESGAFNDAAIYRNAFEEAVADPQQALNEIALSADVTELLEDIEGVTAEPRDVPLEGETEELEEDILDVTENADPYTVPLEAEADQLAEQIQRALDAADFQVDVNLNPTALPINPSSEGIIVPPNIPVLQEGGLLSGPPHSRGGILANLEGDEYVVPRRDLSPALFGLLESIRTSNQAPNDVLANFIRNPRSVTEQRVPTGNGITSPPSLAAAVPPSLVETISQASLGQPIGLAPVTNVDGSFSNTVTNNSSRSTINNYFYGANGLEGGARPIGDLSMARRF